jgi:hypothetical protein
LTSKYRTAVATDGHRSGIDTVEIACTADLARADFCQLAAHLPNAPQDLDAGRHEPSIAEARRPPLTRGVGSFAWF